MQDLTALIGSRICHDLISPIGAIGNGVELLSMTGAGLGPELSLISESVANANARIRFYRIAYGQASRDQGIGRAEVLSVLSDLYGAGRLKISWTLSSDCHRAEAKTAFLALQCLESAMPFGGSIEVGRSDGRWQVTGVAEKMKLDPEVWAVLEGGSLEPVTPALVQFALLPQAVQARGRSLTVFREETAISLAF
jgi:histidine phosphotransferase ChpT